MREKFWAMYENIKYSERYFFYYREQAWKRDRYIKIFLCVASLSSVTSLALWSKAPSIWSIITVAAQVLSAVAYLIPYSEQVTALNNLLPEIDQLLHRIDYDWDRINILQTLSDEEINSLVLKYNTEFTNIENRFAQGIQFAPSKSCVKKAQEDCAKYKFSRFGITQTDYLEETLKNAR